MMNDKTKFACLEVVLIIVFLALMFVALYQLSLIFNEAGIWMM
jgi:hypothetical protein